MKTVCLLLAVAMTLLVLPGCTKIVKMEPTSGPPGTPVYIKCCGMFGDPTAQRVLWDGKTVSAPFPGSFLVPALDKGGEIGKHRVTLVDELDASEAFLVFPIFRNRFSSATFEVTAP